LARAQQPGIVGPRHVGETGPEFVEVGTAQRVQAGHADQVEVVGDEHDVSRTKGRVQAAGGVGDDQDLDAQHLHHAHREGNLGHRIALVVMSAPLHHRHTLPFQPAHDEPAHVPFHGRGREMGDLAIGNGDALLDGIGQRVQAGAQDQANPGLKWGSFSNHRSGRLKVGP
jgi:hypothetical protein